MGRRNISTWNRSEMTQLALFHNAGPFTLLKRNEMIISDEIKCTKNVIGEEATVRTRHSCSVAIVNTCIFLKFTLAKLLYSIPSAE